jgi:class 3 adenylate cyclase
MASGVAVAPCTRQAWRGRVDSRSLLAVLVDLPALRKHLETLRALGHWPSESVERFGRTLASSDAWGLVHINPLRFAERADLAPEATVDLFVHGVKVGLFDLVWSCVCVFCGAIEYRYDTIDRIPRDSFHCTRCEADIASWLDERVEVSFSVHASIARARIDPFADLASYLRYFTTADVVHDPENAAYIAAQIYDHCLLPAETSAELTLRLAPGRSLRLVSFDRHAQLALVVDPEAPPGQPLAVDLLNAGFTTEELRVAPGEHRLRLHNRAPEATGILVLDNDTADFRHHIEHRRARVGPFLSGNGLLCTESFRRLFRVQSLDEELVLNVRHVAFLFSDLKASTALYQQVGDVSAYALVRDHFRELFKVTESSGGTVVKTMGDAIMAAFTTPALATRAALRMFERIGELNKRRAEHTPALSLRIGVHAGPAIVIHTDGRLDYFGQVVNLAARLESFAEPGSLCLAAAVAETPEVAAILNDAQARREPMSVAVRGLGGELTIERVTPAP